MKTSRGGFQSGLFIIFLIMLMGVSRDLKSETLLNVDLAAFGRVKVGFAATGQGSADFWNDYTAPFIGFAGLSNLKMANGVVSTVGLTVQNGAGQTGVPHDDPMYQVALYAPDLGDITVTVTNLPGGEYDFYVYGHAGDSRANSVLQLLVGGNNHGNQTTATDSSWSLTNWVEGAQYVVFRGVQVTNGGAPVIIKSHPGVSGYTYLNGLQISLSAPTSPSITGQPASHTTVVGDTLTFSVTATGSAPLVYQWRRSGTNLVGSTGSTLILTNVQLAHAGNYDVVVSNNYGTAISSKAVVQVLPTNAPVIRINNIFAVGTVSVPTPANLTITGGFTGGLIFYTIDGSAPTVSSTLYSGAFSLTNNATIRAMSLSADFSQTSEAPAITLVILPVYPLTTSVSGSGSIALSPATGPYAGNSMVTLIANASANWAFDHWSGDLSGSSNQASITMNAAKSVQAVFVPTAYPLTLTTPGGGSVTANGSTIAANTYYPTSSIVSLLATPTSGWNFVRWQGTASSTSYPFNLSMTQTQNVQAIFGTVVATNISGSGSVVMSETNPVPFGTVLTNTAVPNPGNYFVSWTGALSGTNNPSTFTVNSATPAVGALFARLVYQPSVTMQPTNQTVASGTATSFSVMATGTEPLSYQWHNILGPIFNATNSTLFLNPTLTNHAGVYFAIVSNPYGQATSEVATLTVFIPATINSGPFSQVVAAHATATFTVGAFGYPALSYQWLFNGVDIPGANSSSLVITNVGTNNLGNYWLEAWNVYSAVTSTPAALLMSPSLQTPFAGLVAIRGREATLNVSAQGSGNLSYQWYKDGQPVSGGTNATLIFPTLQFGDGGLYSVVVTSPYGSITNTPAQLVVNPANISLGLAAMITIEGVTGYTYGIEYTTDLQNTNSWQSLTNITLTQPIQIWADTSTNVLTSPKRFYRVTSQ